MYQNLINQLKTKYFYENWFSLQELNINPEKQLLIELNIDKSSQEICDFFTIQLLNGEYIKLLNRKFEDQIKELNDYLTEISQQIDPGDVDFNNGNNPALKIQNIFSEKIIKLLENLIFPNFSSFLKEVKDQLEIENNYKLSSRSNLTLNNYKLDYKANNVKIFLLTLKILRLEHFEFKFQKKTIRKIHRLKAKITTIDSQKNLETARLLEIKSRVLFKKFLLRNDAEGNEGRITNFIDTLDGNSLQRISSSNTLLPDEFKEWEQRIECQYEIDKAWKSKNIDFVKSINQKLDKKEILTTPDIHFLTKNYKDIHNDPSRLNVLKNEIKFKNNSTHKLLDRYSETIIKSYIYNNYVSSFLENSEFTLTDIKLLKKEVNENQINTNVLNFFPWQKIADKVCDKLEKLSQRLFERETYDEFEDYLEFLNLIIIELQKTMEWSIERNYLPYQNNFRHCFSEFHFKNPVTKSDNSLFFYTSYILPSNYNFYLNDTEKLKSKQIKFDTLKEVYKEIKFVVDEVKTNSQKVNNSERRSIEVLAIFSAVALFSIGSIQIFPSEVLKNDINFFYNFVLSYGYSLALFSLIIWIITRENIKKVHWLHWVIVISLAISSGFLINKVIRSSVKASVMENPEGLKTFDSSIIK